MKDKLTTKDLNMTGSCNRPVDVTYRRRFVLCTAGWCTRRRRTIPGGAYPGRPAEYDAGGQAVPSLALWLTPVETLHVPPLHPEIVAYIIAEARLIRCRFEGCRRVMRWIRAAR